MLREVAEAGERGIPASELIPKREYREFVLRYLVRKGYISCLLYTSPSPRD